MRWPKGLDGRLVHGGDYNPEQWPEPVWAQDVALMRRARVNLVTVGVFAWSRLEPSPGRYTFDWLDRVLDLLHAGGIRVVLATPTASPPPWFSLAHPDALPVTADGVRLSHGSRDTYCPSAPAYRAAARRIAGALARRYAGHPALAMWHVHNEYSAVCHCDHCAAAFRRWLRERHGDLDALNDAWCTSFWSQHYTDWAQIRPPRATRYLHNPGQELDFRRFCSDELLAAYVEQRDLLRAATPDVPVTTNHVLGGWVPVDHARWSAEVDLVAVDHYPSEVGRGAEEQTAYAADLARGWARRGGSRAGDPPADGVGGPAWLLMESAPNLILTPGRLHAKEPGRLARHSLAHVARGSRGAMYFQWRAPRGGAERYHSAMVPHAGPESRTFREVAAFGAALARLAEVDAGAVEADVAIGWDTPSEWALQGSGMPSRLLDYRAEVAAAHRALWRAGICADFVGLDQSFPAASGRSGAEPAIRQPNSSGVAVASGRSGAEPAIKQPDPSGVAVASGRSGAEPAIKQPNSSGAAYRLVVLPAHYLVSDAAAGRVRAYVAAGGHLVVGFLSGVADEHARVRTGGYPGAFRDLLGVRVEEFHPLAEAETVPLTWVRTPPGGDGAEPAGALWSETVRLAGAAPVARYAAGVLAGAPAVTRHGYGAGVAWYVSTRLDDDAYRRLLAHVAAAAGVAPVCPGAPPGVEAVRRRAAGRRWLFLLNHTDRPQEVPADGIELFSGATVTGTLTLPAGGTAVIREHGPL